MTDTTPDKTIRISLEELMETTYDVQAYAVAEQERMGAELMTFHVNPHTLCTVFNYYAVPKAAERLPTIDEQVASACERFRDSLDAAGEQFLIELASVKDENGKLVGSDHNRAIGLLRTVAAERFWPKTNPPTDGPLARN